MPANWFELLFDFGFDCVEFVWRQQLSNCRPATGERALLDIIEIEVALSHASGVSILCLCLCVCVYVVGVLLLPKAVGFLNLPKEGCSYINLTR